MPLPLHLAGELRQDDLVDLALVAVAVAEQIKVLEFLGHAHVFLLLVGMDQANATLAAKSIR
jgi:hypothetical protein